MADTRSDITLPASSENTQRYFTFEEEQDSVNYAEKEAEPSMGAPPAAQLSPQTTRTKKVTSSLHPSLQHTRSYGDGHGFTVFGRDEAALADQEGEQDEEKRFEVRWDGDLDPLNPRCMSKARKWLIVIILSAGSTCVTCTSSMYTSTYAQITDEFHISKVVATLGLSLFVMGLGISPMFLAPLSEFYGRRPIYILSFIFFFIWLIPCALAKNIGTEFVARFIDGMAGSAFLSVAGGTVGDLFSKNELQAPMMIFTASPFIGPPVGPMVAGFINQYTTWYVVCLSQQYPN